MICYRCGMEVGSAKTCPNCGTDLRIMLRCVRISNAYYNDGLQKANVRNLSGAITSLQACLKFNKYHIDARNLLGLVYYEIGEVVDALSEWVISKSYQPTENIASEYLDAIQQNPSQLAQINQTIKKYNQALLYCQQDSRDMAIIQLKKVLSLNPKLVKGHQLLALLYMQEDKLEAAKKSLRAAGRIDTNNTITLRYLKEVNARLRENAGAKKKKTDDLIEYQSGNETIIMPRRFKESSLGAIIAAVAGGIVVGALVCGFLVIPAVKKAANRQANERVLELTDVNLTNTQTIKDLESEIESLNEQIKTQQSDHDGVVKQVNSYEQLLMAYVAYEKDSVLDAGKLFSGVDSNDLSEDALKIYNKLENELSGTYLVSLYEAGEEAYNAGLNTTAIEYLSAVVEQDMDYEDGAAAYYLAQAYRKSDDFDSAMPYYEYVAEHYPDAEKGKNSQNYLESQSEE